MSLRILIADDEPLARARLRALLDEIGGHEVIGEASEGKQVLEMCAAYTPHLVLLDIGMPGMSGMEAAEQLAARDDAPLLIFVTAYNEYAVDAFEKEAVDYLLKPVRKERLEKALRRADMLFSAPRPSPEADETQARTHISASLQGALRLVPVEKIYYFHAEQKYTVIYWEEGQALIDEPLKKLEEEFVGQFIRIHRNALVPLSRIVSLEKAAQGGCYLKVKGVDEKLQVSRRHFGILKRLMKDFRYADDV